MFDSWEALRMLKKNYTDKEAKAVAQKELEAAMEANDAKVAAVWLGVLDLLPKPAPLTSRVCIDA